MNQLVFPPELAMPLQQITEQFPFLSINNIAEVEVQLQNFVNHEFAYQIQQRFSQQGLCIIKDMPVDRVISIPSPLPNSSNTPARLAAIVLTWLFLNIKLNICGIDCVREGALFHDIVPTDQIDGNSPVNDAAWARHLGFHQEMAFMNRPGVFCLPEALALVCLRGGLGKRPATCFISAKQILSRLEMQYITLLQQPIFLVRAPFFIPWHSRPQPLYYRTIDEQECFTYSSLYTGEQPTITVCKDACGRENISVDEANDCLTALALAYEQTTPQKIIFDQGDCVVIDNRIVQHSRTPFMPQGKDRSTMRWLLRAYASPSKYIQQSRILQTKMR